MRGSNSHSQNTQFQHQESRWLWGILSTTSIAIHAALFLVLGAKTVQQRATTNPSPQNWQPITLWSTSSDTQETVSPAIPSPPQAVVKASSPPSPQPKPRPVPKPTLPKPKSRPIPSPPANPPASPSANPTPTPSPSPSVTPPSPTPSPSVTPSPEPTPSPSPTISPSPSPTPSPSPSPGDDSGENEQLGTPQAIAVTISGLETESLINADGEVVETDVIERPVQLIGQPSPDAIASLFQNLGLMLDTPLKLETVIVVELDGIAIVQTDTTKVLQGTLTTPQAEKIVQQLMPLYRFEPTLGIDGMIPYGYTIVLNLAPQN